MSELGAEVASASVDEEARLFDRRKGSDRAIVLAGFALAAVAAIFPWYVFFHQESFGVNPMEWGSTRDLPDIPGKPVAMVSPLAIPDEKDGTPSVATSFDPITTATVGDYADRTDSTGSGSGDPLDQEFPGTPQYQLLHVANGRALIEDSSGLYMVQVGSKLPDNSTLASMEERDGKWVIVTSEGEIVGQ